MLRRLQMTIWYSKQLCVWNWKRCVILLDSQDLLLDSHSPVDMAREDLLLDSRSLVDTVRTCNLPKPNPGAHGSVSNSLNNLVYFPAKIV
jgi:hypothetical protein